MTRPPVLQYGIPFGVTVGVWKSLRKYLGHRMPYSSLHEPSQFEQWADDFFVPETLQEKIIEHIPEPVKHNKLSELFEQVTQRFFDMDTRLSIIMLIVIVLAPLLSPSRKETHENCNDNEKELQQSTAEERLKSAETTAVDLDEQEKEIHMEEIEDSTVVAVKLPVATAEEVELMHETFGAVPALKREPNPSHTASSSSLDSANSKLSRESPRVPLQVSPAKACNSNAQINNFQAYSQPFTY